MRDLFEELKRTGSAAIARIVADHVQESVQLDFKLKARPSHGSLDKDDRAVLGPALSAFANSAGGLVLFGIEASKDNPEKIDAAFRAVPIADLDRFKSEVERAIGDLLIPRHEGIQVEAIEASNAPGTGFLAIWVERSERRPHRSEAGGDKRYYKRAGESTFLMEHYDIEDAFNRMAATELTLRCDRIVRGQNNSGGGREIQLYRLEFSLINLSRISARAPYVLISNCIGGTPVPAVITRPSVRPMTSFLQELELPSGRMFFSDAGTLIHPDVKMPVFHMQIETKREGAGGWQHNGGSADASRLSFDFGIGCENARMKTGNFGWVGREFARLLAGHVRPG